MPAKLVGGGGANRIDPKEMLKLNTFANLLLCGMGQSLYRSSASLSQLDAERLMLIVGDIVVSNNNALMESLYDQMIGGLKASVFSFFPTFHFNNEMDLFNNCPPFGT